MLCFRKFPMTKMIIDKRGRVWGYQDFPSKAFFLRVPECFVGENYCAVSQKDSGSEKLYG